MAKFGFLSVLEEELDKHLQYDFAMDWDKKNHTVEVTFILEAQNSSAIETVDDQGRGRRVARTSFLRTMYSFTTLSSLALMLRTIW